MNFCLRATHTFLLKVGGAGDCCKEIRGRNRVESVARDMRRATELTLWICSGLLLLRAISVHVIHRTVRQPDPPCMCPCETEQRGRSPTGPPARTTSTALIQTDKVYFVGPRQSTLSPDHVRTSLTRLGNELEFDAEICPAASVVRTTWETRRPKHASCPAVFIVGARKAGTTSLYQYLSHHPDFEGIHLEEGPQAGETFYFSSRYYKESWRHYRSRFPKDEPKLTGDASVGNLVNCEVPRRIFESCGNNTKIVMLFRDPIKRYLSNFLMRTRRRTRNFSNNTALTTTIKVEVEHYYSILIAGGLDLQTLPHHWTKLVCKFGPSESLLFEGLYYVHLQNWLCNYPFHANILLLNSEEFYANTSAILAQVYQFLGLSTLPQQQRDVITSFIFNKGREAVLPHHQLQPEDRKKLKSIYAPFNNALMHQLKWHNIDWS